MSHWRPYDVPSGLYLVTVVSPNLPPNVGAIENSLLFGPTGAVARGRHRCAHFITVCREVATRCCAIESDAFRAVYRWEGAQEHAVAGRSLVTLLPWVFAAQMLLRRM